MINFIICEDNKNVRDLHEALISKITMPYDFDYTVHSFEKYNNNLKKIINTPSNLKIYILDLELPGKTGLEIAQDIRKVDWDSIIIVLTSHDELELKLFKEKLLIFDFISKFDNYEKRLTDSINLVIKNLNCRSALVFKQDKEIYHIKYDNILYIFRDNTKNKTKIKAIDKEYYVRDTLTNVAKQLDNRFYQTHRACYVNLNNIKCADFKNDIIYFTNDDSIDYLSRNYKKGLKERLKG
mgnify:FL=1